jgi:hypothetical protein
MALEASVALDWVTASEASVWEATAGDMASAQEELVSEPVV